MPSKVKYRPGGSIKTWSEDDRPREKLLTKGKQSLSNAELIAILIGSGNREMSAVDLARSLMEHSDNKLSNLGRLSVADLKKFKGIGEAKAISIVSAMELGRRRRTEEGVKRKQVTSSSDVYEYFADALADKQHEEFWILLLNRANKIISKELISRGGITGTVADCRLIFKMAIERNACSVILCHNHPSGNLKPSEADRTLTRKLIDGGKLLDVPVLDHIIFADNGYFSFADEGLI